MNDDQKIKLKNFFTEKAVHHRWLANILFYAIIGIIVCCILCMTHVCHAQIKKNFRTAIPNNRKIINDLIDSSKANSDRINALEKKEHDGDAILKSINEKIIPSINKFRDTLAHVIKATNETLSGILNNTNDKLDSKDFRDLSKKQVAILEGIATRQDSITRRIPLNYDQLFKNFGGIEAAVAGVQGAIEKKKIEVITIDPPVEKKFARVFALLGLFVMLIFFLLFFCRLFRYHLKMAQYYTGRADAAALMGLYPDVSFEKAIVLVGADKIDFEVPKSPTDEIIELLKITEKKHNEHECNCCCIKVCCDCEKKKKDGRASEDKNTTVAPGKDTAANLP